METTNNTNFPIATSTIRTSIVSKEELADYVFTSIKTVYKNYDKNIIPLFMGVDPNGVMHFLDFSSWPTDSRKNLRSFCIEFVLDNLIHVCAFVEPSLVSAPKDVSEDVMLKMVKGEITLSDVPGAKRVVAVFVQDMVGLDIHILEGHEEGLINTEKMMGMHKRGTIFWDFYINRKRV